MILRQIPNIISVFRIILIIPIIYFILQEQYLHTLILFAVAGFSDALDGFLAKNFGWQTWIGGFLDPLADKLLLVTSFIALAWLNLLPWWLVILIIARDIIIVGGATAYHFIVGHFEGEPTLVSKLNTLLQILLVLLVVLTQIILIPELLIQIAIYLVAVTTVLSGVDYVREWSRRASNDNH